MPGSATISRHASEPPLSLAELLQLKWLLGGLIAVLGVATVLVFDLSGRVLPLAAGAAILGAALRPAWSVRVPALAWRLVFPALVLFVAMDWILRGDGLATFLRLNVLLIVVRALAPRRRREDLQLLVLCLFLVVVAGVLTVSLGFAVVILAFTGAGLGLLLLVTLADALQGEDPEPAGWREVAWRPLAGRVARTMEWRVVGAGATLFLFVVAVATALFLAIPRFQIENSLGLLQLKSRRSFSGFSDSVRIGEVTEIAEDNAMALRVEVSDRTAAPAQPYWRMVVLDGYRDGTFRATHASDPRGRRSREQRVVAGSLSGGHSGAAVWTCYLEPGVSRYLPLTGPFAQVTLQAPQSLAFEPRTQVIELQKEPQTMLAYRVEGMAEGGRIGEADATPRRLGQRRGGAGTFDPLLEVPAGEANRQVLARITDEVTGGVPRSAEEFAARATAYLGKHHRYSLHSTLPPGPEDPLVRWVATETPGHCELFAGAFILLARQAGHPARLVAGFHGGIWNAYENYYMVRNADAHAWCEIDDGHGAWLRVDPTPAADGFAAAANLRDRSTAIDRSWTARWDSLRMLWYRRVVNFDQRSQDEVLASVRSATRRTGEALWAGLERAGVVVRAWLGRPWNWSRIFRMATAVATATGAGWAAWRWRFSWWARWRRGRRGDPVRRQAGRWLQRLVLAGAERYDMALVRDLQRLRYGPPTERPEPLAVFGRARRVMRDHRSTGEMALR